MIIHKTKNKPTIITLETKEEEVALKCIAHLYAQSGEDGDNSEEKRTIAMASKLERELEALK